MNLIMASEISVQSISFNNFPQKSQSNRSATSSQSLNNIGSTESQAVVSGKVEISEKKSAVMKLASRREKETDEIEGVTSTLEPILGAEATESESGKIKNWRKKSRALRGGNGSKTKIKGDKKILDETLVGINGKLVEKKKKKKRPFFSISLTRDEIEMDLEAMGLYLSKTTRSKRMKKRSESVQKVLDNIFPGLPLKSINPNNYRVN